MKGKNREHNKKVKKLMFICTIFAIVVMASTYAWFIGMKTVNVNTFDIKIATTEGLFLSMDGEHWSYNLDVNAAPKYEGNTNVWATDGLIPMSSVGDMDSTSSTMKLYEKGSLTAINGGYRLLASRVHNYEAATEGELTGKYIEGNGYVAFDLFVKNISGAEYYVKNNPLNEEKIYLTRNSSVAVANLGGVPGTGIENSVRVAVTQIGRVNAEEELGDTSSAAKVTQITGIDCTGDVDNSKEESELSTDKTKVTGICRDASIWEPNDKAHVANAIEWYNTSCKKRTGEDILAAASYTTDPCGTVANGTAYQTYAIANEIIVDDMINIYDGADYNTYDDNTKAYADYIPNKSTDDKLVNFPYFTDTMKETYGANRPEFMTLAPNSITKLRVYIYIEGQDIDNYDFAALGKAISVNFGFTKEQLIDVEGETQGTDKDVTYTPVTSSDPGETDITPDAETEKEETDTPNLPSPSPSPSVAP